MNCYATVQGVYFVWKASTEIIEKIIEQMRFSDVFDIDEIREDLFK